MATTAIGTTGTKLKMGNGDGPPETFVDIGQIFQLSGPNEKNSDIEITNFDSTGKEYMAGLSDGGEVTFSFILDPDSTSQAALRTARANRTNKNFKIVFNDATAAKTVPSEYSFNAAVTGVGNEFATDDKIVGNATLKVSGAVTFTARHAGT